MVQTLMSLNVYLAMHIEMVIMFYVCRSYSSIFSCIIKLYIWIKNVRTKAKMVNITPFMHSNGPDKTTNKSELGLTISAAMVGLNSSCSSLSIAKCALLTSPALTNSFFNCNSAMCSKYNITRYEKQFSSKHNDKINEMLKELQYVHLFSHLFYPS